MTQLQASKKVNSEGVELSMIRVINVCFAGRMHRPKLPPRTAIDKSLKVEQHLKKRGKNGAVQLERLEILVASWESAGVAALVAPSLAGAAFPVRGRLKPSRRGKARGRADG